MAARFVLKYITIFLFIIKFIQIIYSAIFDIIFELVADGAGRERNCRLTWYWDEKFFQKLLQTGLKFTRKYQNKFILLENNNQLNMGRSCWPMINIDKTRKISTLGTETLDLEFSCIPPWLIRPMIMHDRDSSKFYVPKSRDFYILLTKSMLFKIFLAFIIFDALYCSLFYSLEKVRRRCWAKPSSLPSN